MAGFGSKTSIDGTRKSRTKFIPSYANWYEQADRRPTYRFLERCLKALQFLERKKRWLLKTPEHLLSIGTLVETFPDATFVQTHRDPVRITASLSVMIAYGSRMQQHGVDPRKVNNPRGKHGLVDYRLEDLGVDVEERRRALRFYCERFGVAEG